ncbi:MAG TPA: cyclodeaminase/cyclohydrolase family protein [Thermomicrobiales bacterium]|nr:cyclodeaminase/cyclohydrolase family protein [Thermomicrobiales bacterium]
MEQGERTLHGYIAEVASSAPAPGGGSVAGVVGALAASLGSMVANMTIARKKDPSTIPPELPAAVANLSDAMTRLLDLSRQDELAYSGYISATRLPKETEADRSIRHAAQQDALRVAADVPLATAEICRTVLIELTPVAQLGTRHALADCSVGAWLATAAAHAALINVRTNATIMDDPARAAAYTERAATIEGALDALRQEVLRTVDSRNSSAV